MERIVPKISPPLLILISFLVVILAGTLLLKLPAATTTGRIAWIDALFTSTSAVCVTGLIVIDTGSSFTLFGQSIILSLIQIGGLGVMTIAFLFFLWMGRQVSYSQRSMVQSLFTHSPRRDILKLIKSIAVFTLLTEATGTIALYLRWRSVMPEKSALYHAVFHSVSAFCNAGFSLNSDSMAQYRNDIPINLTICALIILGGIGFPVLYDILETVRNRGNRQRFSLQSKTALLTSLFLIITGAIAIDMLNPELRNGETGLQTRVLSALFQSVTCRTAGFNTVDIGSLSDPSLLIMIFLMFVGASPGSCGGGVKTTTLAVMIGFALSRLRRRLSVEIFHKTVPDETVKRSMALIILSAAVIFMVLVLIESGNVWWPVPEGSPEAEPLACLFETVSAFGTVGLSMGLTPFLTVWSKFWIIVLMIIGRLGMLTFAYLLAGNRRDPGYEYSEENVMIG